MKLTLSFSLSKALMQFLQAILVCTAFRLEGPFLVVFLFLCRLGQYLNYLSLTELSSQV